MKKWKESSGASERRPLRIGGPRGVQWLAVLAALVIQVGCGGGKDDQAGEAPAATQKAARKDASLFAPESLVSVNRFYQTGNGVHFYTASTVEAQGVRRTRPDIRDDGIAFDVSSVAGTGLSPVHRFFRAATGTHFYTISESEKAFVQASLPQFAYEGVAYYASTTGGSGLAPLHRFFKPATGTHFYTLSDEEAEDVRTRLSGVYSYEGVAYHVMPSSPVAPLANVLPHTGITGAQCLQAGSDDLVPCTTAGASALSDQQDGNRVDINALSFSQLGKPGGGLYSKSECVRDNVTGLIWEGKTATGPRAGNNLYTNLDDVNEAQVFLGCQRLTCNYRPPTQSEVDALTNSVGYLRYVNGIALCGYTDWRIPTANELHSIADYSTYQISPLLRADAFPNLPPLPYGQYNYWTATESRANYKFGVLVFNFFSAGFGGGSRSAPYGLRLVRGASSPVDHLAPGSQSCPSVPTSVRFVVSGAEVKDKAFGLTWARCSEGQTWDGSTCTGSVSLFTHEQAIQHAQSQAGWRLPNVKELASLVDWGCNEPTIDSAAFPGTPRTGFWTSTPMVSHPRAMDVWFGNYEPYLDPVNDDSTRGRSKPIRLVRR